MNVKDVNVGCIKGAECCADPHCRAFCSLCYGKFFPKEDDDTEIKDFSKEDLAVGLKQFKLLRKAFDIDKDLNKILKGKK